METRKAETRFCELKDNDIRIIVETQKTGGTFMESNSEISSNMVKKKKALNRHFYEKSMSL